jgi:hypothetical protein
MESRKRIGMFLLLAATGFLLPLSGIAAEDEPDRAQEVRAMRQQIRAACGESAKTLCAETRRPRARMECMLDNYESLPENCQALLDNVQEDLEHRREMLVAACEMSMDQACPGREGPGMVRCLKGNYESVSENCQAFLDEIPDPRWAESRMPQ